MRRSREVFHQVGHLDRDTCRIAALVFGAGPGLGLVLDGQDRVGDGNAMVQADAGHGGPQFSSDEIKEAVEAFLEKHLKEKSNGDVK